MTRFARAVEKEYQKWLRGPQEKGWLSIAEIHLQREHAAVVRKVKAMRNQGKKRTEYQSNREVRCAVISAYTLACDDLLAWLHERGR